METNTNIASRKLHTFQEVQEKFFRYISNQEARDKIKEAYDFVFEAHKNQYRKSGEPYVHHLIEVCYILSEIQCGPSTLIAGLLHDVVEDTNVSLETIIGLICVDIVYSTESPNRGAQLPVHLKSTLYFSSID